MDGLLHSISRLAAVVFRILMPLALLTTLRRLADDEGGGDTSLQQRSAVLEVTANVIRCGKIKSLDSKRLAKVRKGWSLSVV